MAKKPVYDKLPEDYIGNFEALLDWPTYVIEAKKLRKIGIARSGVHGMSCSKCYKQVQVIEFIGKHPRGKAWCACKDKERPMIDDIRKAHGFALQNEHRQTWGSVKVV